MSSSTSSPQGGSVGFFGLLGILFIGLKLVHIIDWSWWYVLLPLYGPLAVFLAIIGSIFSFGTIRWVVSAVAEKLDRFSNS
jgi:hypothetical protein